MNKSNEEKRVLVIAAHPDDEVIGCGGAMAKHAAAGDQVHVLILAEGLTSRDDERAREKHSAELELLEASARRANDALGVSSVTLHDFPDNRMDSVDLLDIVKEIERAVDPVNPTIIYTHHWDDLNIDHRIVFEATVTACRPAPGSSIETILTFEVASSTEWRNPVGGFSPDWFVDISPVWEKKKTAIGHYVSEMRQWPHARSIEALEHLVRWRGATVGVDAAEAFQLFRAKR